MPLARDEITILVRFEPATNELSVHTSDNLSANTTACSVSNLNPNTLHTVINTQQQKKRENVLLLI